MYTTAKDIWDKELKPFIEKYFNNRYNSDPELTKTLEQLVNRVDSDFVNGEDYLFRIEPVMNVLNSQNYYRNVHKDTFDDELKLIKDMATSFNVFYKVAKYELRDKNNNANNTETKDRLPNKIINIDNIYGEVKPKDRLF